MKKSLAILALLCLTSGIAEASGRIQNEDVKSLTDITAAVLTTTGTVSSSNDCIASPGSTLNLAVGLYIYDTTTPGNVSSGTTIAGLPGTCSSGQIQMSANGGGNGSGDTLTFGGQKSQLINDTKLYSTASLIQEQLSSAITDGSLGQYMTDGKFLLSNTSTPNKQLAFSLSGASSSTTLTLTDNQSTSQSLAIPNVNSSDSLVTNNTTATLSNKTISGSSNTLTNIPGSALPATAVQTNQANTYTSGPQSLGAQTLSLSLTNDTSGTTSNELVILDSNGEAITALTSSTSGVIGVAVSGAGTSGTVQVSQVGQVTCAFDGTATDGDYVQISTTSAGKCHDAGATSPSNGSQNLGQIISGGSGAGNYTMLVTLGGGGSIATPVSSANGGFGISTASDTGVPVDSSGTWTVDSTLPSTYGGTGQNLSSSTGALSVASGTVSAGTLSISNGGTNSGTASGAFTNLSPQTTKGDLIGYSSSPVRLAVPGDYGQYIPDSNQTTGYRSASYTQTQNGKPGKNYIQYADFENNSTTGWSLGTVGTLTNGLPTGTPTFGSGASGNLSIASESSSPIAGSYSLGYVSSAATTQGNMVASSAYSIDNADQAKVLTVKFYYSLPSGSSNVNASGSSSNSYAWAAWDATNSTWLSSAGNFCMTQLTGQGYCTGTFQTGISTASIRFVVYNANATSGAATLYLDDFYVGPQTAPMGPAMTDWVAYTPTGSWTSNTTYAGQYRRIGDTLEGQVSITLSGAPNATQLYFSIPSGYTINTSKSPYTQGNSVPLYGAGDGIGPGGTTYTMAVAFYNTSNLSPSYQNSTSGSQGDITATAPVTWASGNILTFYYWVPITGWSSNTNMSSDTDTRVVAANGSVTTLSSVSSGATTLLTWGGATNDTHGAWNGSTTYTVPVSGYYSVTLSQSTTSGTSFALIYHNGAVTQGSPNSGGSNSTPVTTNLKCSAGDTIQFYIDNTGASSETPTTDSRFSYWSINRLSGPAVVAATESVNARLYLGSNQTINGNGSWNLIEFNTRSFDTHNAYNTGTYEYVAPVSGKNQVNSAVQFASTNVTANLFEWGLWKNGNIYSYGQGSTPSASSSFGIAGSDIVQMNAGDYIQIEVYTAGNYSSSNLTVEGSSSQTYVSVTRVGN